MLSNKENALAALNGLETEKTPCYFSSCKNYIIRSFGDLPPSASAGKDGYGVHQTPTESAGGMFTPTVTESPVITDITKWKEQLVLPDLDNIDWEEVSKNDLKKIDRENFVMDVYCVKGIFERLHFLMGFENALMAIMEEPEYVNELLEKLAEVKIKAIEIAGKYYKPEIFTYQDDYAYKDGLLISPEIFRTLFKPHLKKIFEAIKENGMIPKFHCCGKMETLIEDFIEIGAKIVDPCQPCNDLVSLLPKYNKVCFIGGLDVQYAIDKPGATEEDIRKETRRCIDVYGKYNNYIIYGASLSLYKPDSYNKDGVIGIIMDEASL